MIRPNIQYVTTTDGARIAYWMLGEGEPYIICYSVNAIDFEWQFPEAAWAFQQFAVDRTVVRFDLRGDGLSSEAPAGTTFETHCADLQAVIDRIGADRYALHGGTTSSKLVVHHAAHNPERVSALTLHRPTVAAGERHGENLVFRLIAPLAETDPILYSQLVAVAVAGLDAPDFTRRFADYLRATHAPVDPDSAGQHPFFRMPFFKTDVTSLVPDVRAPVLVLHRSTPTFDVNLSRAIASAFVNGGMAIVDGSLPMPWDPPMVNAIRTFLARTAGETLPEPPASRPQLPEGIALILFTDIVDSTALTERMGDAAFRDRARALDTLLRSIIAESGGVAIDGMLLGDGVLATFRVAAQGIAAGLACASAGDDHGLPLHVGLHAGDVIRESDNVYGGAVNIASRICALAAPGEVLVSRTVADLARTSAGVTFEDRGEHALKGIDDAVRVFAVRGESA